MDIASESLIQLGFAEEEFGGKAFYRYDGLLLTNEPVYGWALCDPTTYNLCGQYITTLDEVRRLMAQKR
ncbi:MAG: hypothetical protein IJ588_14960 [Prevotella sp.]|nr:hypothetical protein [Prevotella sp.]MBR1450027.1 hypothetical protein [Prevotella sp.]